MRAERGSPAEPMPGSCEFLGLVPIELCGLVLNPCLLYQSSIPLRGRDSTLKKHP